MAEDNPKASNEAEKPHGPTSVSSKQTPLKDGSNVTKPTEPIAPETKADQGLIPHTTTSSGTKIVEVIVETGKTVVEKAENAVNDGVAWIEKKAREINVDGGVGPYASPGTCLNSDLDVIGAGILPAMTKAEEEARRGGEGQGGS
ncbi:hypothetical protein BDV96DRAFT_631860 [Lophiotrema nucula]|uniref:Uncharacterized protein n=1 Tax=Lophiotrema nucula TaxID=690887 RepID=A0A6A5Z9U1_9PLEO|nr:hypothetical protein BDV96DRAFT_631860 [Lophiotrema nucula]